MQNLVNKLLTKTVIISPVVHAFLCIQGFNASDLKKQGPDSHSHHHLNSRFEIKYSVIQRFARSLREHGLLISSRFLEITSRDHGNLPECPE